MNTTPLISQIEDTTVIDTQAVRTSSLYIEGGFLELVAIGYEYQINEKFSVALKINEIIFGGQWFMGPMAGAGGGVKFSYYFAPTGKNKFLIRNVLNVEMSLAKSPVDESQVGFEVEGTIGHNAILGKGLGTFSGIGVAYSYCYGTPALFFLALKAGLHYDF